MWYIPILFFFYPTFFIVEDINSVLHVSLFVSCVQDVCSITIHNFIVVYGMQVLFEPGLKYSSGLASIPGGNLSSSFCKRNYFQIYWLSNSLKLSVFMLITRCLK
jgi:hypothetical protein